MLKIVTGGRLLPGIDTCDNKGTLQWGSAGREAKEDGDKPSHQ